MPVVASLAMAGTTPSQGQGSPPKRSRWHWPDARTTRIVVVAAAVIYAIIFIALNRTNVRIHFVFFTVTTRLWVGFLVCVALGVLLGHAVGVYRRRRATRQGGPAGRGSAGGGSGAGGATPAQP